MSFDLNAQCSGSNHTHANRPPTQQSFHSIAAAQEGPPINRFNNDSSCRLLDHAIMEDFDTSTSAVPYLAPSTSASMWQRTLGPSSDAGGSNDNFLVETGLADPLVGLDSPPLRMGNTTSTAVYHTAVTHAPPSISAFTSSVTSPSGPRKQNMKQLTQLGMLIEELQNAYVNEQADQAIPSNTFPFEYSGKVLQAATFFLSTLESFYNADYSASSSSLGPSTPGSSDLNDSDPFPDHADDGRNPPSFLNLRRNFPDTPFDIPPCSYGSSARSSTAASARTSSSALSLDTSSTNRVTCVVTKSAVLQLIACYLSFLQLYLQLYTAVHEYLRTNCPETRRTTPIWPDLRLGGTSLAAFADVQIALVLQVAAQLLAEIEDGLGLPDSCQVSGRSRSRSRHGSGGFEGTGSVRSTSGAGVLGTSGVSTRFVELSISEVSGGGQGADVIARLRKVMGQVARLLEPDSTFQANKTTQPRRRQTPSDSSIYERSFQYTR